jgi:hypothetical protein
MVVTLKLDNAKVPNVGSFSVRLGEVFSLVLRGIYSRVRWSADNDEVLSIDDDFEFKARITATAVGTSRLTIKSGHDVKEMDITVFDQVAVTLNGTIGEQTPDN